MMSLILNNLAQKFLIITGPLLLLLMMIVVHDVSFSLQIVGQMLELEKMVDDYETLTTGLLEWIKQKITELNNRNFPNSLEGIQKELIGFKDYRTVEKPPK